MKQPKPSQKECKCDCHKALYNDGKCECQPGKKVKKTNKNDRIRFSTNLNGENHDVVILDDGIYDNGQCVKKYKKPSQPIVECTAKIHDGDPCKICGETLQDRINARQPEVYKEEKGGLQRTETLGYLDADMDKLKPAPSCGNCLDCEECLKEVQTLEKPMSGNQPECRPKCFILFKGKWSCRWGGCKMCHKVQLPADIEGWGTIICRQTDMIFCTHLLAENEIARDNFLTCIRDLLQSERKKWESERMDWLKRILPDTIKIDELSTWADRAHNDCIKEILRNAEEDLNQNADA